MLVNNIFVYPGTASTAKIYSNKAVGYTLHFTDSVRSWIWSIIDKFSFFEGGFGPALPMIGLNNWQPIQWILAVFFSLHRIIKIC